MIQKEKDLIWLKEMSAVLRRERWRTLIGCSDGPGLRLAFNLDRIAFGNEYYWPALGTCYHPAHDGKPAVLHGKYLTQEIPPFLKGYQASNQVKPPTKTPNIGTTAVIIREKQ